MLKCKACGHDFTKGDKCPHCDSTEFENPELTVEEEVTPEPKPTEDDSEEDNEEEE